MPVYELIEAHCLYLCSMDDDRPIQSLRHVEATNARVSPSLLQHALKLARMAHTHGTQCLILLRCFLSPQLAAEKEAEHRRKMKQWESDAFRREQVELGLCHASVFTGPTA